MKLLNWQLGIINGGPSFRSMAADFCKSSRADRAAYFIQPHEYAAFFPIAVGAHVTNDELGYERPLTGALLEAALMRT